MGVVRLTPAQLTALRILDGNYPLPTYPSNRNGPVGGSYAAGSSMWVLVRHGLARWEPHRRIGWVFFITQAGRERLREENEA